MSGVYYIEIDKKRIGYTKFEYADPPMGVVHGKIIFENIKFPYDFLKNYCANNNVQMNADFPDERLIHTVIIPQLKVFFENGDELLGWGGAIRGIEPDDFEIEFGGVSSELMKAEFKHHYIKYYENN
jgi:hypothetical protein